MRIAVGRYSDFERSANFVWRGQDWNIPFARNYFKVNETLSDLAKATSDAKREEVLRRIRVDCSPMNQKWLVRVSRDIPTDRGPDSESNRDVCCLVLSARVCCFLFFCVIDERDGEGAAAAGFVCVGRVPSLRTSALDFRI